MTALHTRLWLLVVVPSVVFFLASCLLLHDQYRMQLAAQAKDYGEAVTLPIADLLAHYVQRRDQVSLTVLATGLQERTPIATIEVYDIHQQLLAQAGGRKGEHFFSRQITYQDSTIGHLHISLDTPADELPYLPLLLALLVLGGLGGVLWVYRPQLVAWALAEPPPPAMLQEEGEGGSEADAEADDADACLLVCRIRPFQQAESYQAAFLEAIELNRGVVETADYEELTASFNTAKDAVASAMLLQALVAEAGQNLRCGAALGPMDQSADTRRRLTYLASQADHSIVADSATARGQTEEGQTLEAFRHPLIDREDLVKINAGDSSPRFKAQARELLHL